MTLQSTKTPYLIGIDLNDYGISLYPLKEGINIFHGLIPNEDDNLFQVSNKIYLNDTEICRNFCFIKCSYGQSIITLLATNQVGKCMLNGSDLINETEFTKEIYSNDLVLVGKRYIFQYKDKKSPQNQNSVKDFFKSFFGIGISDYELNFGNELADLNEKVKQSEYIIDEQRRQIQSMNEQIRLDQSEINRFKELNFKTISPDLISPASTSLNSINFYENELENKDLVNQYEIISKEMDERETMHNMLEKFEVKIINI